MSDSKNQPGWLKHVIDIGPIAVFFGAYMVEDLLFATAALMVATAAVVVLSLIVVRTVPMMPLVTAVIVGIFGGLTLILKDDTFIKMKPTIVEVLFALILFGGLAFKRPLLKPLMGAAWPMTDEGWVTLTKRFAWFFLSLAALNEIVWRTQSTDFWVTFKVFGLMALTFVFILTQIPLMQRHAVEENTTEPGDGDGDDRPS